MCWRRIGLHLAEGHCKKIRQHHRANTARASILRDTDTVPLTTLWCAGGAFGLHCCAGGEKEETAKTVAGLVSCTGQTIHV